MATASPAATAQSAARDHRFHQLRIARVTRETADTSSFVLEVPPELESAFVYEAGQFCTFRVPVDGHPHYRSYSMSSSPAVDQELQVTVKRVPGGAVSNWMIDTLAPGDTVDTSCPAGVFRIGADRGDPDTGDIVAFAAGSGITPVLSIVKSALATTARRVHLLYANRDRDSIIFAAELERLGERYPDRLVVLHHLDVEEGFVDAGSVRPFAGASVNAEYFICGPAPFMDIVESTLLEGGVGERQVHIERFTPPEPSPPLEQESVEPEASRVTIELGGRADTVDHHPGTTILQTARQMGMTPPSSCESGTCATCMARLAEGAVAMQANDVLTDEEVAEGWVLTCQAVPTTASVRVVYEEV